MGSPGQPPVPPDLVVMAQIKEPYGLKGWIKLYTFGEAPDGLRQFDEWWCNRGSEARPAWERIVPEAVAVHGGTLVAKWPGIEDRDAAFAQKGLQVAVSRSKFSASGENEYYWSDLIGLAVKNRQDEGLGRVVGLLDLGPHEVLRVQPDDSTQAGPQSERLIPFVAQYIDGVDLVQKVIRVDWGLDF